MRDHEEDEDDLYDGDCTFCGERVRGREYLALSHFAVMTERRDGISFDPDDSPNDYESWGDVPVLRAVHVSCLMAYVEGVIVEANYRRSEAEAEDAD